MNNKYYISNEQDIVNADKALENLVIEAIEATLEYEGFDRKAEVSVTFTDNDDIRSLNWEYRKVDAPTDVLSFPMDDDIDDVAILGDIVLSLEKAREQSKEYGHSFERETAFLIVHATLHLLGYDHETSEADEREMFGKQEEILNNIGQIR